MLKIDYSRNKLLTEQAVVMINDYYCKDGEDPQEALMRAAVAYSYGDNGLAQRVYDAVSRGWFMFASPVLSNAPSGSWVERHIEGDDYQIVWDGDKPKGLPISCFLTYVDDSLHGLIDHSTEVRWLSVKGGGVGGHWSGIRAVSDKSPGAIPFLKTIDADMTAYRQGKTRKGSYAAYLDVDHPDIEEFLQVRVPTGGDPNRKTLNLHNAVNITDKFMEAVMAGEPWYLIDPHTGKTTDTLSARGLWQKIIETRFRTGEPYLNFIDEANRHLPEGLKEKGLKIHGSNLCNEIHLPTSKDRTAVCCLSSLNLEKYDEWKDTGLVSDLIRFLDNVLQFFIDHAPSELERAKFSAVQERSLGLGAMGFHGYLQSKMIPFESPMATTLNLKMFKHINDEAIEATLELGAERGEAPDMGGSGRRNAHLLAIAPNANSSILLGCSPSIETWKSNAFTHRTRIGSHLIKNKYLDQLLKQKLNPEEVEEVWLSIIRNQGSCQHLECLTAYEKDVFKTSFEIDQRWVVDHAADRQPFICQGQSVNLFFPSGSDKGYVNEIHLRAWAKKLKGLYYLRTSAGVTPDQVGQTKTRVALKDYQQSDECLSCHG